MSSNITVEISADVTKLKTQLAVASAELKDSAAEVRKMAREYVGAADDIKASMLPQLEAATVAEAKLRGEISKLTAELREQGEATSGLKRVEESIAGVGEKAEALNSRLAVFSKATAAIGELAVAGFGLESAFEQVNKVTETGEAIGKLSESTGLATEQISALRVVATETGTDFEKLQGGLRQLAANMQEALINPASTAGQAFQAMGIKVDDGNGHLRDAGTVLAELSAKLASYKESTDKTELAADTLGKKFGSDLIPVMNRLGSEGFDALIQHAKDLNQNFTQDDVEAATKFQESLKQLDEDFQGIARTIVDYYLPALNKIAEWFTGNTSEVERYTNNLEGLENHLRHLQDLKAEGITTTRGDSNVPAEIASVEKQIEVEQRLIDLRAGKTKGPEKKIEEVKPSSVTAPSVAGNIAAAKAGKADAPDTTAADEAARAAEKQAEAEKRAQTESLDSQLAVNKTKLDSDKALLEGDVTLGEITAQQKIEQEIKLADQIYQADAAALRAKADLYQGDVAAHQRAMDQIAQLTATHNAQIAKLNQNLQIQQQTDANNVALANQRAAQASEASWNKAFQPIGRAFDTTVTGIIQGTQTLQQAEARVAQSIVLSFVQAEEHKLQKYIASQIAQIAQTTTAEAAKTGAVIAGVEARNAATAIGAAQGKAQQAVADSSSIIKSAYTAAANTYASVAAIPIIGPILAPAAAAGAFAAVAAFDVVSAEGGLERVGHDGQLISAHKDEAVLPARIARPLLEMAEGGGGSNGDVHNNFHFHGVGPDIEESVRGMLPEIARATSAHFVKNPSSRPKY